MQFGFNSTALYSQTLAAKPSGYSLLLRLKCLIFSFNIWRLVSRKIRSVHGIPLVTDSYHESPPTLIIFPSYSNLIAPTKQSFSSSLKMSDTTEFNFSFSMKTSEEMSSYYTGESKTGLVCNVFLQTVYVRTLKTTATNPFEDLLLSEVF